MISKNFDDLCRHHLTIHVASVNVELEIRVQIELYKRLGLGFELVTTQGTCALV